jgi:hypothetical protein
VIDSDSTQTKSKRKHEASNKSGEKELMIEKLFFCAFKLMDSMKHKHNTKTSKSFE